MKHELARALESVGAPPPKFWESELEIGIEHAFIELGEEGWMEAWVEKRKGRQAKVLLQNCGMPVDSSPRKNKATLRGCNGQLLQYALVDCFGTRKSKQAVIDVAAKRLAPEKIDECREGEGYDTRALLYAIYHDDPTSLREVFLLDKVHKSAFARMVLDKNIRRPGQPLADYLSPDHVVETLRECDLARKDGRTSELKAIRCDDDHCTVYVRRAERPEMIVGPSGVLHGYKPEWIILDFFDGGKRVNISSTSIAVPVHIANRLAAGYFGQPCEYVNEKQITTTTQVERLLGRLKDGLIAELSLTELTVSQSPLKGQPKMTLSSNDCIGPAIDHFQRQIGELLMHITHIVGFRVMHQTKRISLKLEHVEDGVVVRYSDGKLNRQERKQFEAHMEKEHDIIILSKEKRFK